jgi:hypothetical protein
MIEVDHDKWTFTDVMKSNITIEPVGASVCVEIKDGNESCCVLIPVRIIPELQFFLSTAAREIRAQEILGL